MQFFTTTFSIILALVAPGTSSPVNITARFPATMHQCKAARIGVMNYQTKLETVQKLQAWQGDNWYGTEISNGRGTWFLRDNWRSSEECWDHCRNSCLMPAASYGFDAAFCQLRSWGEASICAAGYTGDTLNICHNPKGKEHACSWHEEDHLITPGQDEWLLRLETGSIMVDEHAYFDVKNVWHMEKGWAGPNLWMDGTKQAMIPRWAPNVIFGSSNPYKRSTSTSVTGTGEWIYLEGFANGTDGSSAKTKRNETGY
ncbi:MAG: hypothetical protein MMC23_002847 [Stictis urceolatum]|nr:hypothetical protein [Stictis urceolata]